ncbi:omptin family outer membrane protease [Rhizobium mongolense]|uniref:Omptin n=1 Tax=Rhizobium mongolense USDA 1844 TaxID=1079460 RepID=A0A559TJX5_9HYPH|nr:omptin family outer membrane protease [Rhizobium mongolense]TVZ74857.1 omptin [Rhizobium mongolense USDA 1844]
MFCEYFHFLKGLTRPASQRQGDTGPSTPVACAVGKSDATQRGSEAKKLRLKTEALYERRGQLMKRVSIRSVAISCFLLAAPSFAAADNALFSSDDGNVVVFGDIGLANIKAQEFVYEGDHKLSQLNWESKGMTLFTAGVDAQIDNDWSLKGSVKVGAIGDGHMTDYDWYSPRHDDWSDRSIHPDTELDHYVAGSIEIDRIIYGNETSSVAVGAGVRYTDVKWTAYGGSHVYSRDGSFRNRSGTWPSGKSIISYRQKIPVGFVSLSGEHVLGDLTISGGIQGGLSFGIKDIDDHWVRDLRFWDDMSPAPTIGANVAVSYAVTPAASLYLSGSFERVFHSRGDWKRHDFATGENDFGKDFAGATFEAMSVSFGLKGTF